MALQGIADQLLQEGLLLTALELHAELTERGKGLSSLREFFDNSTNFEKFTRKFDSAASPCLSTSSFDGVANLRARAPSQATLDSISLFEATRFSEDSHAQNEDRMAVLEFELRKARDTIHSLRSELTSQAAKSSAGSKDIHGDKAKGTLSHETSEEDDEDQPEIQAVEQRTLNYLVNEYLLQHNYKLTSITFSDENSEEDFEDWDSIGLNVSKPPNLLRLYRDYKQHVTPERDVKEFGCQTNDRDKVVKLHETISALEKNVSDLQEENVLISEEVQKKEYELKDDQVMIESLQKNQEELEKQIDTFKCSKSALQDPDAPLIASNRKMGQEITPPPPPCLSASQSYVKFIESRCLCDTEPKSSSSSITEESQDEVVNLDSVLTILAESVPKIVPNVILAKRDELIPLLMITIQIHPDSRIRDQFLNILFNLIKRPDLEQRKMILSGFLLMAAKFGATRIEAELLPQCWEQINHKYDERRILVAETCGTLMPYIPSSLRCSLLLSMLTQLALEDREPEVRCAAIRSLAVLVLYLEDEIKFESLWNLVIALLKDPEGDIVLITQDTLLLSMAHFSMNLGTLETVICEDRLLDFDKHCDLAEEEKSALESRMLTLKKLLPFVIYSVMTSAPQIKENVVEETSEEDILDDRCSIDLEILLGSSRKYLNLLRQVQEILGKEWYESWSQLEWISNNLLAKLASCSFRIPMLDMDHDRLTDDFISLVQDLVLAFGPKFAKDKLSPHFERFINLSFEDSNSKEEGAVLSDQILLPIYSLGLLRHVCTPLEIAETLKKWILFHVISGHNTSSLTFILDHLGRSSIHQDPLAETAWQLVVHQTPKVRCFASKYLNVMSRCCLEGHDDILGNKILPGLVTLSSDPEEDVRISSIAGLGTVMTCANDVLKEKACFQFMSSFEDGNSHFVLLEVVRVSGLIWRDLPTKIREEILLPKIAKVQIKYGSDEQNHSITSEPYRTEFSTILLATYTSITAQTLSVTTVHNVLNPSLQKLLNDITELVPGLSENVRSIMSKLEDVYGVKNLGVSVSNSISNPVQDMAIATSNSGVAAKISQSPSLDEMKQKMMGMGKLFNRQSNNSNGGENNSGNSSSSPFWKKS